MRTITFFKTMFVAILLLVGNMNSFGQIATWDFTNAAASAATIGATTFDQNLVSSNGANDVTRGVSAAGSTGAKSFRTQGFKNEGISITNNDYFQITLAASAGYTLSLSTIDAKLTGTQTFVGTAGVSNQFAYSLNGIDFILIGTPSVLTGTVPLAMPQINLSTISALQNVATGTTVTLRYYASGQTTTGGWGFYSTASGSNGLEIGGTVNASVPTGIANPGISNAIYASKGGITLNALAGESVDVYNAIGQKLVSRVTIEGMNTIPVTANGVVIVKVGNRISKMIL